MSAPKVDGYTRHFAERAIAMMEAGTAPWQRLVRPGTRSASGSGLPTNRLTGKRFKGTNVALLAMVQIQEGYPTAEWLTEKQAASLGGTKREDERYTLVKYWEKKPRKGKKKETGVDDGDDEADAPASKAGHYWKAFYARSYNVAQFDGLPEVQPRPPVPEAWRHAECERLLEASGAVIRHDGGADAYYRPGTDSIHLPQREDFKSSDGYYATALHELGHWTGHESRLNRDLSGGFGSESYGREELRAELFSWMAGEELSIGHDPEQHAAYLSSWIKAVKSDPTEIVRACVDAQKIIEHLGIAAPEPVAALDESLEREKFAAFKAQFDAQLLRGYGIGVVDAGLDSDDLARYYAGDTPASEAVRIFADDYNLDPIPPGYVQDIRAELKTTREQRDALASSLRSVLEDSPAPRPASQAVRAAR